MSYDNYEQMKKNSMQGEEGKRTGRKMVRIPLDVYKKRLKVLAATVAIATGIILSCAPGVMKLASDNWTISKLSHDFHIEYVAPETHRTDDGQHYFYDYNDIASHLEEYGDFDEAVYLLNIDVGYYQTGQVLKWTPYESFTNYLAAKGYKDEDEFKNDMKKQITKKLQIQDLSDELKEMQEEHTSDYDASIGGK